MLTVCTTALRRAYPDRVN